MMIVCGKTRAVPPQKVDVMTVRSSRFFRLALAVLVLSGAGIVGTATTANADTGCGEYSFGFAGTRLLNDGISNTAGPFTIAMPAGTYAITLHSFDDHIDHPGQTDQTQEQWYFTLDSGYISPVSSDIPDDAVSVTDTFTGVIDQDATSITVHHLGQGNVNSVSPMCVGFTTVTPALPAPEEISEVPAVEAPVEVAGPELTMNDVPVVPVEVKPAVEVKAPAVAAPVPSPAPQLAITGPSAYTWALILAGASLLALGAALVLEERRRSFTR